MWYEYTPTDVVYEHTPTDVVDMTVAHNRPDIILVEKDFNVVRTEDWKVEKHQKLHSI